MDVFGGAPRFLAYPRPVVVQSGTDAVLKCQIGGDPRPAVIWERNNEKIDPQGRYRVFEDGNVYNLIISAVTTEDSGQYICKAKNSIGETYAAATLKVEGEAQEMEFREENKPRFLIKPLSTRAGRGDDAVFSCKLWGNPRPEVVWEKDGRKLNEIFESTHFTVGFQDGGWFQLKIFKTRAPDGGVYTCKARNEFGEALAGAVLLVDAGPSHEEEGNRNGYTNGHWKAHQGKQRSGRQVSYRLKDDTMTKSTKVKMFAVTEGKHAKFRCFVTGKPKPEIIWRKDGRLILSGRRYLLYEDREGYFTLKVLYCKQKDNGVYVCAASNTAGQTLSAVHLSVKEPPVQFKQPLIDLEVWERDLAVLECEVPEDSVAITWYLEDRRLQPGAKYGMEEWGTKRRLTIRDIGVDDDGIYLCEMPDGGRSIAEVAVKGTILRKLPRKVDVLEGENAAFCVEVEKEEMDIHWYKDAIELRETHQTILKSFGRTHILVFVNTMPQDSGLVTFLVGRSKTSSMLRVKAARHCPPSCPVAVQINTERANAALLSWVPAQDSRKNPPSGYVLERQEVGTGSQEWLQCLTTDSATSVEILGDSVPCEADYRFRICSVNKYGKSNNVEFPRAVHLVPVARIQAPLQDALVPEGQDAQFSIELSASVIGTWFLNGTQLQEDEHYSMRRSRTHQSLRIRGVRDTDNGAEITFIAYGIRDSAALYIQAPLVKFSPMSEMDRNKFVEIGNPIVLYCELSDPAAPVHWYKNGVELQTMEGLHIQSEGTMRRIVIQSAEFSHSGVYCCDAIDDVIRFNVEVEGEWTPPVRFSAIPDAERNKTIETGYPIVLCCELSDPSAQVHWYKDGSKLNPQTGVEILTDGLARKLIVHSAEFFHAGLYCCKTKGDTITFSVDIKAPPVKFSAMPEEMRTKSIEAGGTIVLQCVVSDPEAQVCWYKDEMQLISNSGLEINSEGNIRTLVVQSAELCHSGVYRCTTQDDTMEFQVEIKAIPVTYSTIFDVERTKSLEAGKLLELKCEVADSTVPVCWYKDAVKLCPQNDWDIQSNGTLKRLIIPSAEVLPSGLYSCETSDDTIHFTVDTEAPMLPLSPSPEVVETQSLEATCPTEPTCETSDPAFQVSWQRDKEHDSNKDPDFEMGGIKKTLVIEPTHPSNSGAYYCATADDVAQLIVNNQVPAPTYLLGPGVVKTESAEADCQIVQQFEISDPIAKACWYKDGTQIYPKREADCKSQSSSQTVPLQLDALSDDGRFGCETSGDEQLNVDMKAEQCHCGDEIGEIADASAQYTVDVKATSPRLSSEQDKKSTEEAFPVEVDCMSSKCNSGTFCGERGDAQTYEEHSIHMPTSQSTYEYMTEWITPKQPKELSDDPQTTNAQSPVYCNSVKPSMMQSDTHHHTNKLTESHGEEFIYYIQHAKAPSEELDNSPQTAVQTDEICNVQQTAAVESEEATLKTLTVQSDELHSTKQIWTVQSELGNPLQTSTAQSEHLTNHLQISTVKSDKFCNSLKMTTLQSEEPFKSSNTVQPEESFKSSHTATVQPEKSFKSSHTATIQPEEPFKSSPTATVQPEESFKSSHTETVRPEEPLQSTHSGTLQLEEPFKTLQTAIVKSEELCSSIQLPAALSEKLFDWVQTETVHSEGPYNSLWTATDQSEELNRPLQTSTVRLSTASSQSLDLHNSKEAETVQPKKHYNLRKHVRLDDHTGQAVPNHSKVLYQSTTVPAEWNQTMKASEDQVDQIINSGQRSSTQFAEPQYVKQTSTVQSEEIYLSKIYDSHWSDSVTANKVAVEAPPVRITTRWEAERNKSVEVGEPIVLRCEISDPNGQVNWYKDGINLHEAAGQDILAEGSIRTLAIQSAMPSHAGIYSCKTTDDAMQFHVDVEAPLLKFSALSEGDQKKMVMTGFPIALQCELSDPTGQVSWYKDGTKLLPQNGVDIQSEGNLRSLVVPSAERSHTGVYRCESKDDDIQFAVEVKAPPVTFVDIPEEDLFKSVVEKEEFVLSCEISRADGVVQWYKDGTEMQPCNNITMQAEGTTRNLTVHSAQLSDTGTYTCRAGDNVLMYKVNIREPPVVIIYPKEDVHLDRHVPEEIILSCELSRPNGVVSWYKDGQKLQESENIKLKIEGPYRRLKIISSGVEDSGEYVCDTADASIFFHLSITEPPVRIVSPSQSQMELCQQTSERMVLSCEISRPNAVVRWYRDGLEVEENDNLILEVDGVYRRLIIPETTVKDSAEYVCDTADESVTFFVNIAEPPVRFVRPRKMAGRVDKVVGETLVLDCEVSRSNAEVTWKKNGEEVEDSKNITILEDGVMRQLTVHSLTMEDAGQYVCDAKDDVMDFNVNVQELPVKILGKTDAKTEKQFLVSDDIILVCELSRSNASVSWYKDNQLIEDTERYCSEEQGVFRSLVVLNAGLEDSAEYTCDAVDDKMVFYITVKEPQVQIIGNSGHPEHHILVEGDDLILECEVSRSNATVQWLCNGVILKPDTRIKIDSYDVVRKLVISGLQPSDSGKYICDAIDDKLTTIVEVQELPVKFENKKAKNNVSGYENESVTLCAIVSRERANVRWLKDGQLLNGDNIHISSEGNTHKLTINPLQLSDSGQYVCDVNTDEMYFSLLVKEMKVKFLRPLENAVSLKGSSLILRCEINKPKGDVQWLKDGQEISPSRRHTIRAQGRERSFTIHQLVEEDAGEYACESTDDRTSATVTVETPRVVEFIAELRNITVCEGEDAVFKCVVSPEDSRLVWRLNGKQVALNERPVTSSNGLCHMLCIHNCMVSDSGRVTADAEGLVSEAELHVQEQQVLFTKKMTPVVAEEYSEATLEVEVSLDSGEVQWMRQGVLIHPGAKNSLKHKGRKHSLTIYNLAMSDRGTYSCETLHDRTQAQLTVEPRKITIKKGLTDIKTTERETASFEVELSHPDVQGTWMRNAIQLKPTNHFRMSAKGQVHSLTISNLSVEDTGTFMFCVENLKTTARLVVKEPPVTIFRKLEDQKFPDGAVISIECELSRHNVDVKWMKNGVELKPSKDLRIYAMGRKRFLQIMKCHVSDSGTYTCDVGDATTSCTVEVYERELLILQRLEDVDIQEDQNAVFVCEVSVEDVPGEWYKNGERIQPTSTIKIRQEGTKHFLLMCNVKAEDSGEIKFVTRHVESVASLEVEEIPVNIVKPLQDTTALEESRVLLDCTVSNPRCSIRWYKGSNVVLPSERFEICSEGCYRKLIIQQVVLDDEGTYSVQVGEYTCSAKLTVEAKPVLMVSELKDVEVTAPGEARFECEVSVPVLKAPVWSLNGEPLQPSSRVRLEKMGTVHRLTLRHTSPDMSGVVEFTSGKANSRAQLRVLSDP
ncbi:obscurin-like protein 1 isoform X7 [Perca flavescens]|uniref:obscurin-like protein 1 isoform X7 n=1 Tax=Perca flavescens TaxID=8167 RepID=UPI00106EBFC9|nr:obscurin-like protein 1 isoform X7 [Perca flavescens]